MTYAEALRYFLDAAGMSQAELARRIGSPKSTITALVKGRAKEPTLGTARRIAHALGVTLDDFAALVYPEED